MIPVLYNKNEQQFRTYGLGEISDIIDPKVTRERNGQYILYFQYPQNAKFSEVFEEDMRIKSDAGVRTKWQTFEISRVIRKEGQLIEVFAKHISQSLLKDALRPGVGVPNSDAQQALNTWNSNRIGDEEFDVWSDITTTNSTSWNIREVSNAFEALAGVQGSILDVWGGEYEFDNKTIRLHKEMGRKSPVPLEYGRNITGLEQDRQEDNIYTSIYPFAVFTPEDDEEPKTVTLPEHYVDGKYLDMHPKRKIQVIDFSGEFEHDDIPTVDRLRTLATQYTEANEIGLPHENLKVEYIDLSKTLDYQEFQIMEEVELNDRLPIFYPNFGITNENAKVVVIVYDPIKEENISIELGVIGRSFRSVTTSGIGSRLDRIEKQQNVTASYIVNNKGNRIWYTTPNENMEHKIGDTWFEENGQYTRIRIWNGNQWETIIDSEDIDKIADAIDEQEALLEKYSQDLTTTAELANSVSEKASQLEQSYQDVKASTDSAMNKAVDAYTDAQSALASIDGLVYENRNLLIGVDYSSPIMYSNNRSAYPIEDEEYEGHRRLRRVFPEGVTEGNLSNYTPYFFNTEIDEYYTTSLKVKPEEDLELSLGSSGTVRTCPANEWTTLTHTFKASSTETRFAGVRSRYDLFSPDFTPWIEYKELKAEKGSVATDWSPAPEDVNEEIANAWRVANEALSDVENLDQSVRQEFTNIDGRLSSKAEQTTVNEINRTVQNQGSELLQAQDMIALKADQTDVDTLNGIIETNSAELSVLADEISAKVDKTIVDELNQSVETLSTEQIVQAGKISERLTRTEVNAEIERRVNDMAGGEFNLEGYAEVEYVENLIENTADSFSQSIESVRKLVPTSYENRNLLRNSGTPTVREASYHKGTWWATEPIEDGEIVTISAKIYTGSATHVITLNNQSGKRIAIEENTLSARTKIYSWTIEWTNENGDPDKPGVMVFIRPPDSPNTSQVEWIKLERGSKATGWSPAPEDLQNDVTILRSDYERTAEEVTDRLTKIDGNNGYISEIKRDVGSLTSSITEYEEGTTQRFNVIESDVEGTKQSVANLKNGTSSQFNVMSDEISAVVGKVNNIGGRNLFTKSHGLVRLTGTPNVSRNDLNGITIRPSNSGAHSFRIPNLIDSHGSYTVSFEVRANKPEGSIGTDISDIGGNRNNEISLTTEWQKYSRTDNHTGRNLSTFHFVDINFISTDGLVIEIRNFKLERGEVATDWSPAPEDGVSKNELISEINIQADRQIFRVGDNRLMITEDTTYLDNAVIKSAHIADLAVTGAKIADASISSAKIISLDADQITGNTTNFIQSSWNSINSWMTATGNGIEMVGDNQWRRNILTASGIDLYDRSGASNKAGTIGYFVPHSTSVPQGVNSWITTRIGTPKHGIGIGANYHHDIVLGYEYAEQGGTLYRPALEVRGATGDVDISTRLIMKNGGSIIDVNTLRYNQLNTEIGTWDGSITYRANRHHRFFSSNNQELFNIQDNGYANLYARLNMQGHDVYNQSDERLKRNIMPSFKDSLGKFSKLEFKWFEYLENRGLADGLHHGVMAQDVLKFAPEWVIEDEQGYYSLNQSAMLMDAFKAIMQLSKKVKKLEAK